MAYIHVLCVLLRHKPSLRCDSVYEGGLVMSATSHGSLHLAKPLLANIIGIPSMTTNPAANVQPTNTPNQPQQAKNGQGHASPHYLPLYNYEHFSYVGKNDRTSTGSFASLTKLDLWAPWKPTKLKYHSWRITPQRTTDSLE